MRPGVGRWDGRSEGDATPPLLMLLVLGQPASPSSSSPSSYAGPSCTAMRPSTSSITAPNDRRRPACKRRQAGCAAWALGDGVGIDRSERAAAPDSDLHRGAAAGPRPGCTSWQSSTPARRAELAEVVASPPGARGGPQQVHCV